MSNDDFNPSFDDLDDPFTSIATNVPVTQTSSSHVDDPFTTITLQAENGQNATEIPNSKPSATEALASSPILADGFGDDDPFGDLLASATSGMDTHNASPQVQDGASGTTTAQTTSTTGLKDTTEDFTSAAQAEDLFNSAASQPAVSQSNESHQDDEKQNLEVEDEDLNKPTPATVDDLQVGVCMFIRGRRAEITDIDYPLVFWRYLDDTTPIPTGTTLVSKGYREWHRSYTEAPDIFQITQADRNALVKKSSHWRDRHSDDDDDDDDTDDDDDDHDHGGSDDDDDDDHRTNPRQGW